jgi:hypothetical protein
MDENFGTFLNSIGLSTPAAEILRKKYEQETTEKVEFACEAAQLCLGPGVVHVAPLNKAMVEANW